MLRCQTASGLLLVHISALGDADHRIVGLKHRGFGEIDVVRRHQRQVQRIGEVHQPRLRHCLGMRQNACLHRMALQFHIQPPRIGPRQPRRQTLRFGCVTSLQIPPQRAVRPAGQADHTLRMRLKFFQSDRGQSAALVHVKAGRQLHQMTVTDLVLRQKHDRGRGFQLFALRRRLIGDAHLTADDRLDALVLRGNRKLQRREHRVGVGHRDGGHVHRAGQLDQLLHRHRAFQQGMLGMHAQMDESGGICHAISLATRPCERHLLPAPPLARFIVPAPPLYAASGGKRDANAAERGRTNHG